MSLPWAARQFVKLLPIAFVPSRHFVHAVPLLTLNTFFDASLDAPSLSMVARRYLRAARQNPVDGYKLSPSLLTIYACASMTRHFLAYCFKPVTGLIVSRPFALAAVLPLRLEPGG